MEYWLIVGRVADIAVILLAAYAAKEITGDFLAARRRRVREAEERHRR